MPKIVLDVERMKYANTGLFEFGKQLGFALLNMSGRMPQEEVCFYTLPRLKGSFGADQQYITVKPLDRYYMPPYKEVDVWHTSYQISPYKPSYKRTRRVLTIHDLNSIHENRPAAKIRKYINRIQRNIDQSDHIVTISNFVMEDVRKHLDLKNKPASVILNGCELKQFPSFDTPAYRPQRPFLFAIGTVLPKKNFHVLPALLRNNNYELIIAGTKDMDYVQKIEEEGKKHNVSDRLKIIGPVSEEEKFWYYNNCTAFLFPSLAEGFGFPVVEAMQVGKPVFISRYTSLPEIGGEEAYYFNSFDPDHMQDVFTAGMHHYETEHPQEKLLKRGFSFNWENTAQDYFKIYRSLY